MGQRHQLFVIARIAGRYRSLAAVHHQWLYGSSALRSCTRLVEIFNEPYNRRLLELELNRAVLLPPDVWTGVTGELNADTIAEFPFITTCLMHGAAADFMTGEVRNVMLMPWNCYFNDCQNNDGITVLDVTVPQETRYCFVHWQTSSMHEEDSDSDGEDTQHVRKPPINWNMVPLTGEEYLRIYKEPEDRVPEKLRETRLIPTEALQHTWPSRPGWDPPWQARHEIGLPVIEEPSPTPSRIASLAEITMEKSIERLLDEEDVLLEEVEELPIFRSSLMKYLACHPEVVTARPFGFDMLQRALRGAKELDLGPFPDLSGEQIITLIEEAAKDVKVLDISFNPHFTLSHLSRIPSTHVIQKLYAWDNEQLPYEDLKAHPRINRTFQRETFLDAFREYDDISGAALISNAMATGRKAFIEEDTPLNHTNLASQLICVQVGGQWKPADSSVLSDAPLFNARSDIYKEAIRTSGSHFENTFSPVVLPLHDVEIGPEALLSSIYWAMRALSMHESLFGLMGRGGLMLAWALTLRHHESSLRLDSLPPRLYANARAAYHSNAVRIGSPKIIVQPGKWNVLLIQEKFVTQPNRIRIGFLTADNDSQLRVCDASTFLKETGAATFKDTWERLTSGIKGYYGGPRYGTEDMKINFGTVNVVPCDEGTVRNLMALMEIVNGPSHPAA